MEPQVATTDSAVPTAPDRPSGRPRLWLYMVVGVVILALVIGGIVVFATYRPSPVPTVTNFVEDIVAAQYLAAYIQTSSNFQSHQSQAEFAKAEAILTNITGVVSGVAVQRIVSPTEEIVTGQIQYSSAQNDNTYHFTVEAIWADHSWQVNDFTP